MRTRKAIVFTAAILALVGSVPTVSAATTTPTAEGRAFVGAAPGLGLPAASVTGVTITPRQAGDRWTISIGYSLSFTAFETRNQFPFETWVDLWEQDSDDDDLVLRGKHVSTSASSQSRTATFRTNSDTLDTELGAEEIYARAFVKNLETGQVFQQSSLRVQLGV
ncbi:MULTISPECIES: hypothetical protein [unclassified Streptomyces]|uniref:hypothetical protein n=1 Tax=unclassified Streptomyces TaxID=2593676 RepID=UPI001BE99F0C|nr:MULTISPECIES: hypothetical protein [unclassified Streptomyces]MBT2408768.1 hypothetical protein [Streptomyces sp. ISL-21]MBT2459936.1 hypothetical protein [Streptomyces sp. ISL-86]MBT2613820.1 hypothetical protein [Streptomyces sp. ISL-87]